MGVAILFQLVGGLPAFLLAAFGFWVCRRHLNLSPWMWCLLVGLVGILSKTGFQVLFLVIGVGTELGLDPQVLGGETMGFGFLGLFLSQFAGWLGEGALLLGIPMVIRDLAGQFQLWKELQSGEPSRESG